MGSTLNIFIKRSIMQLQFLLFLLVLPFVVTQIPSNHRGHVDSCFQKHCSKEQFFACLTKDEDVPIELQEEGVKGYDLCYIIAKMSTLIVLWSTIATQLCHLLK